MKDRLLLRMRRLTHICIIDNKLYDCPFANNTEELDMKNFDEAYKDYNCVIINNDKVEKVILGSQNNVQLLEETIREYKEKGKQCSKL